MPMIVRHTGGVVAAADPGRGTSGVSRMRRPMGSSPGNCFVAKLSVTIAVSPPGMPSLSVKTRPRLSRTLTVRKNSGVIVTMLASGARSPSLRGGRPSMSMPWRHAPKGGTLVVSDALSMPGTDAIRCLRRSKKARRSSTVLYFVSGRSMRIATRFLVSMPMSSV
jgi:hypothetical protein